MMTSRMGIMGNRFVSVLSLVVTIYQFFQAICVPKPRD
jgi:hypothetical protein